MIDIDFLESLIRALDASGLDSLELERGGTRIRLSRSPSPSFSSQGPVGAPVAPPPAPLPGPDAAGTTVPAPAPALKDAPAPPARLLEVTSPMVGTFYRAPAPDAPSYVEVGQSVGPGTVLCIIEAMKLMNELESEVSGTITKILVENAQPVEYGQLLFLIDPS